MWFVARFIFLELQHDLTDRSHGGGNVKGGSREMFI